MLTRRLAIVVLILTFCPAARSADLPEPGPLHVLMISVDGLRPTDISGAKEKGLSIPHLESLARNGVAAEGVIGVLPSVTYPSHVTLITGVPPRIHGIESNHVLDPEDIGQDPWYWFAEDIRVPTLIDAAEAKGLVTGSVSWPATIGLPADYVMPEFWRGRSRHPFDRRFMVHLSSPGLIEAVSRWRGESVPGFSEMTDRDRVDVARWIIASARPHLMLVHIFDLDFAAHRNGPDSPEAQRALEASDAMVGRLLNELDEAGLRESTVVFIVSDHGFLPAHTAIAPNTLLVEAGIIRVDDDGRVLEWDAYFRCDSGSAALVLRDPSDERLLKRIDDLVTAKSKEADSGIFRVLRQQETEALGSRAVLALDAASGYDLSHRVTGPWSDRKRGGGSHGHAPDRREVHASLVISGPPLASRGDIGLVPMTRIAPTVAALLGLRLAPEADEPLPLDLEAPVRR